MTRRRGGPIRYTTADVIEPGDIVESVAVPPIKVAELRTWPGRVHVKTQEGEWVSFATTDKVVIR